MERKLRIRVGARVRTRDAYPYTLPKGLPNNAQVDVVSYDTAKFNYVVRDAAGQQWTITASQNLDAGSEYKFDGKWLPASDPRVIAFLEEITGEGP